MLVKELIEQLQKLPQDSKVMITYDDQYDDKRIENINSVELNVLTKNDIDSLNELGHVGDAVVFIS